MTLIDQTDTILCVLQVKGFAFEHGGSISWNVDYEVTIIIIALGILALCLRCKSISITLWGQNKCDDSAYAPWVHAEVLKGWRAQ